MLKENSCIVVNRFEEIDLKMNELLGNISAMNQLQNNALKFSNKVFFDKEKLFKKIEAFVK